MKDQLSSKELLWWYITLKGGKVYRKIIKWRKTCLDKREGRIEILLTLATEQEKKKQER